MKPLKKFLPNVVMQLLFPRICASCGGDLVGDAIARGICSSCLTRLEVLPLGSEHCFRRDTGVYVCALYSGRIAAMLISYKKGNAIQKCFVFAFIPQIAYYISNLIDSNCTRLILTHPPGSLKSKIQRGYDHMHQICRCIAQNIPPYIYGPKPEILRVFRRHRSKSQKLLSKEERKVNMEKAISLQKNCRLRKNDTVIILDDVITTGATMDKCRHLVSQCISSEVHCIALLSD